jgi:hypothetical protein
MARPRRPSSSAIRPPTLTAFPKGRDPSTERSCVLTVVSRFDPASQVAGECLPPDCSLPSHPLRVSRFRKRCVAAQGNIPKKELSLQAQLCTASHKRTGSSVH